MVPFTFCRRAISPPELKNTDAPLTAPTLTEPAVLPMERSLVVLPDIAPAVVDTLISPLSEVTFKTEAVMVVTPLLMMEPPLVAANTTEAPLKLLTSMSPPAIRLKMLPAEDVPPSVTRSFSLMKTLLVAIAVKVSAAVKTRVPAVPIDAPVKEIVGAVKTLPAPLRVIVPAPFVDKVIELVPFTAPPMTMFTPDTLPSMPTSKPETFPTVKVDPETLVTKKSPVVLPLRVLALVRILVPVRPIVPDPDVKFSTSVNMISTPPALVIEPTPVTARVTLLALVPPIPTP